MCVLTCLASLGKYQQYDHLPYPGSVKLWTCSVEVGWTSKSRQKLTISGTFLQRWRHEYEIPVFKSTIRGELTSGQITEHFLGVVSLPTMLAEKSCLSSS